MHITNVEFKARVDSIDIYERKLLSLNPVFIGIDHQIDTYFNANQGRLKLREGNIENALIQYDRQNISGSKASQVVLYRHEPNVALKNILTTQLGIKVVVDKRRKIYFIDNVKFHFDIVEGLGSFIEVEAIDDKGQYTNQTLKNQCDTYAAFFELTETNFVDKSYSELLLDLIQ